VQENAHSSPRTRFVLQGDFLTVDPPKKSMGKS